ncbi:hypothetical protein RchiOBHm_Chr2g0086701 [Rosa chinensis]|uniref:Uncharacterized protein n=1 Tax=Rosa chinensis TaxID=74649 RepID=A0A2P6RII6_ROSCH|nr:uncharacterized protein LOC112188829 [Rosa chinensis]PRQ46221.1 hypothetical protein RchiOBHm_Chr2g0086701 [Rosa chinensis]
MDLRLVEPADPTSPSGLKKKLRSSLCIIPCFTNSKSHHHHGSVTAPTTPQGCSASRRSRDDLGLLPSSDASLSTPKSARSHHHHHHNHHHEFSELKDKCRKVIGRMGRHSGRRHSGDFKYDELSYALNFDHEDSNMDDDSFPLRNFSARLPHSPPAESAAASPSSKEITACS